jgi:general stress protein 26
MSLRKFKLKAFAGALYFCVLAAATSVSGQESRPLSRDELIAAAREVISTARYCALITSDSTGRSHARTMDPFPPDEEMMIWLGTNSHSRKVAEIRRRPRVTLYYFDRESQAYVTIQGIARLVNDANEKARHWKDEWQAFYPNRDKDYLLIQVRPLKLEVVNTKKGILGDQRTWKPPTVTFGPKR